MKKGLKPYRTDAAPKLPVAVCETTASGNRRWRGHAWRTLALWGVLFSAYCHSFDAGLVYDSAAVITQDPRIRAASAENAGRILTDEYWHTAPRAETLPTGLYRPLTTFSYLLNYSVLGNGTRPAGYHWLNFVLHAVNASLVYALAVLLLDAPLAGLALAALWGVHPVLAEAVTNIVGRADLLAALGVLCGLLCYAKAVRAAGGRKAVWLAGLMAAQTVAIFSKESGVMLPGLVLLHELVWPTRTTWRTRGAACAAMALPVAAWFCLRTAMQAQAPIAAVPFVDNPLVGAGFWPSRLTAMAVIAKSVGLFLWPVGLSADYSYNAVPVLRWPAAGWSGAWAAIAAVACLAIVVGAIRWRRKWPAASFFVLFFLVAFLPTCNLVTRIGSIMAERFLYLPSVGLAGCVVVAASAVAGRVFARRVFAARAAWTASALACALLAARTYARNLDWHDDLSLWTSAIRVCPESFKAHHNLAQALAETPGRMPEAIAEYQAALRIYPASAPAHNNLGVHLAGLPGRLPDAITEYQAALRIQPDYAAARNNLGNALARLPGREMEAMAQYRQALASDPNLAEAHFGLGNVLSAVAGRQPEAIAEYRAAVEAKPDYAAAHNNLANLWSQTPGHASEAIAEYRAALSVDASLAEAHLGLGNMLSATPDGLAEAIAEYRTALRLKPDSAPAHNNLGSALVRVPDGLPKAIEEFQAALRIQPDYASARHNLGLALASSNSRVADAVSHSETAPPADPRPEARPMVEGTRERRP